MEYQLNETQLDIRDLVREYAQNELPKGAEERDRSGEFPTDIMNDLFEMGLAGIGIPEEYEGAGMGVSEKVVAVEELAKIDGTVGGIYSISAIFPQAIIKYGTKEQKEKYLKEITVNGKLGAFALTEANAGSDAGATKTTAIFDEKTGEYVLNGSKTFITSGKQADFVLVFALTDPAQKTRGMSAIIVEKGTPGFTYGKIEDKMGIRSSETVELIFQDCRVPKENLLGVENKGFGVALSLIDTARIGVAAQAIGIAQGAFDLAVGYAKERMQFGKPIANLQGIQWYLAEMATSIMSARSLMFYAAKIADEGKNHTTEAAMAKLYASRVAREVTNLALQIHGGYGYMKDFPLERMYRDAKITEIYEGTSEVQKLVIARSVLK
jgi:alkylation response protein AidB-like acyl-CoA dehydrogenase